MKKRDKKLVLAKETLMALEREDLDFVVGALGTGPTNCQYAQQKATCSC